MTNTTSTTKIDFSNIDYTIITKTKKDILSDVDFETEEDKLMCDAIITNLEKYAATKIKNGNIVSIPIIGTIRIDPIKSAIRDNAKVLKLARANMSKQEYKEYAKELVNDIKNKNKEFDDTKKALETIKVNNKKKYETYCSKLGSAYADMFIYSIYLLEELPFDKEWEEQYQRLKELE